MTREEQIEAQRKYSALIKERDRLLREKHMRSRSARSKALADAAAKAVADAGGVLDDAVEQKPKAKLSWMAIAAAKAKGVSEAELAKRVASIVQIRPSAERRAPSAAKTITTIAPAKAPAKAQKPVALTGSTRLITAAMHVAI